MTLMRFFEYKGHKSVVENGLTNKGREFCGNENHLQIGDRRRGLYGARQIRFRDEISSIHQSVRDGGPIGV